MDDLQIDDLKQIKAIGFLLSTMNDKTDIDAEEINNVGNLIIDLCNKLLSGVTNF